MTVSYDHAIGTLTVFASRALPYVDILRGVAAIPITKPYKRHKLRCFSD